jgi:hypothetical protein
MKIILIFVGIVIIIGLFMFNNVLNKPIYNKMSNVWEDDPVGRSMANVTVVTMILIAFLIGLWL